MLIASAGHSSTHTPQSTQSSGFIIAFSPSITIASLGQASMHDSQPVHFSASTLVGMIQPFPFLQNSFYRAREDTRFLWCLQQVFHKIPEESARPVCRRLQRTKSTDIALFHVLGRVKLLFSIRSGYRSLWFTTQSNCHFSYNRIVIVGGDLVQN